jgi:hypothetical protein
LVGETEHTHGEVIDYIVSLIALYSYIRCNESD